MGKPRTQREGYWRIWGSLRESAEKHAKDAKAETLCYCQPRLIH